jgi:peptidoglycan L-alanyl-D-glutamate endopeptidase CwlK
MASVALSDLTPDTRVKAEALIVKAAAAGLPVRVISTRRSCADQLKVPVVIIDGRPTKRAPGCRSWHPWGRAFDVELLDKSDERYRLLGEVGKSIGLVWGGDFATNYDPVHFEYAPGISITAICPDPEDCEGALARGGAYIPPSTDTPATVPVLPAGWRAAVLLTSGALIGFLVTRTIVAA